MHLNPLTDFADFEGNAEQLCSAAYSAAQLLGLAIAIEDVNERAIRYYVTAGVLDKPERIGRDAAYRLRQLLQLLTCRSLQSKGFTIAQIVTVTQTSTTADLQKQLTAPNQQTKNAAQKLIQQFRGMGDSKEGESTSPTHYMNKRTAQSASLRNLKPTIESDSDEQIDIQMMSSRLSADLRRAKPTPTIAPVDLQAELRELRDSIEHLRHAHREQHREMMQQLRKANDEIEQLKHQLRGMEDPSVTGKNSPRKSKPEG